MVATDVVLLDPRHDGFLTEGGKRRLHDQRTPFFGALAFWGVVAVLLGITMLAAGVLGLHMQLLLGQYGINTQAVVIDRTTTTANRDRQGNATSYNYHMVYQFVAGGQRQTITTTVSPETYERLAVGSAITIRYLPDNSRVARIVGEPDDGARNVMAFGLLMLVSSLLLLYAIIRLRRRNKRLAQEGQLIGGRILDAKRKRVFRGGNYVEVKYEFFAPDGTRLIGTGNSFRPEHYHEPPSARSPIAVLYVSDRLYRIL